MILDLMMLLHIILILIYQNIDPTLLNSRYSLVSQARGCGAVNLLLNHSGLIEELELDEATKHRIRQLDIEIWGKVNTTIKGARDVGETDIRDALKKLDEVSEAKLSEILTDKRFLKYSHSVVKRCCKLQRLFCTDEFRLIAQNGVLEFLGVESDMGKEFLQSQTQRILADLNQARELALESFLRERSYTTFCVKMEAILGKASGNQSITVSNPPIHPAATTDLGLALSNILSLPQNRLDLLEELNERTLTERNIKMSQFLRDPLLSAEDRTQKLNDVSIAYGKELAGEMEEILTPNEMRKLSQHHYQLTLSQGLVALFAREEVKAYLGEDFPNEEMQKIVLIDKSIESKRELLERQALKEFVALLDNQGRKQLGKLIALEN